MCRRSSVSFLPTTISFAALAIPYRRAQAGIHCTASTVWPCCGSIFCSALPRCGESMVQVEELWRSFWNFATGICWTSRMGRVPGVTSQAKDTTEVCYMEDHGGIWWSLSKRIIWLVQRRTCFACAVSGRCFARTPKAGNYRRRRWWSRLCRSQKLYAPEPTEPTEPTDYWAYCSFNMLGLYLQHLSTT